MLEGLFNSALERVVKTMENKRFIEVKGNCTLLAYAKIPLSWKNRKYTRVNRSQPNTSTDDKRRQVKYMITSRRLIGKQNVDGSLYTFERTNIFKHLDMNTNANNRINIRTTVGNRGSFTTNQVQITIKRIKNKTIYYLPCSYRRVRMRNVINDKE